MNDYVTAAKFLAEDGMRTLPIACRFVPFDQWLVTHVDTSWKVKDIKQWILSKCNVWGSSGAPQPPRFRPASPVTFSAPSRRSSLDSSSWAETEEGVEDDWDVFAAVDYNAEIRASESGLASDSSKQLLGSTTSEQESLYVPPPPPQRSNLESEFAVTSAQFTLVSFSNGFILEDDADLSWYKPRAFELLEVHRSGAVVSLPRGGIAYAEPYFESPIRVSDRPYPKRTGRSSEDQQAHTVDWKPRWAIIRDGVLHLCKDSVSPATHRFPIAALCALSGPEHFGLVSYGKSRVICAKFNRMSMSGSFMGGDLDEVNTPANQRKKKLKTTSWVLLNMPNRSSHDNLLRILHRLAPHLLQSSFTSPKTPLPSPSTVSSPRLRSGSSSLPSPVSEPSFISTASGFFSVQYPEWRLALLQRCRAAGRGVTGSALEMAQANCLVADSRSCELYHPLPRAQSISEGLRRLAEQETTSIGSDDEGTSRESDTSGVNAWKIALSEDEDEDEEDDVESEVEWDGWMRDLARRATRPPPLASPIPSVSRNTRAVSPSSPSSSEVDFDHMESGGTARVRTFSSAPRPLHPVSPHRPRSNTISAAGTALGETYTFTSTTTTTITTYVDRVPDLRAPSISTAPGTWTHQSLSGPTPSTSASGSSPRNTPRARRTRASGSPIVGSLSARLTPPPNAAGPGSFGTSSPGSEVLDSGSGRNGGIGAVRRIVQGVSIRNAFNSERFVRGLEDALDFVDGR